MRNLRGALDDHDLVTLRVIGDWWELDLTGADKDACVQALSGRLEQVDLALEFNYLPPEEANALQAVAHAGGQMAVGAFARQFGNVRQMGPGKLEREEPWLSPENAAEALWYRGLLYRGFDDADDSGNLVEYYFIPEEFLAQLSVEENQEPAGSSGEEDGLTAAEPPAQASEAMTTAVDDMTTLLSLAQRGDLRRGSLQMIAPYLLDSVAERISLLLTLAEELDIVQSKDGLLRPTREAVRWLKQSRALQASTLAKAWREGQWNELLHTPGIRCEGSGWQNDPKLARETLLEQLPRDGRWYQTENLVQLIRAETPDFQRPEGNYDTWYIRDIEKDVYLKGFESWDLVEGRLLRYLLEGPMHWLGLSTVGGGRFRLTEFALAWLAETAPSEEEVQVPIVVQPSATVLVPYNASRYERFQVARIAEPLPVESRERSDPFEYQVTPDSLRRAAAEGIDIERVLDFLKEASGRAIPAGVRRAIARWQDRGVEGRLQRAVILRVRDAAILDTLQENSKTRPYIGERLGELAAVLLTADWRSFQQLTAQLGLFLDCED